MALLSHKAGGAVQLPQISSKNPQEKSLTQELLYNKII